MQPVSPEAQLEANIKTRATHSDDVSQKDMRRQRTGCSEIECRSRPLLQRQYSNDFQIEQPDRTLPNATSTSSKAATTTILSFPNPSINSSTTASATTSTTATSTTATTAKTAKTTATPGKPSNYMKLIAVTGDYPNLAKNERIFSSPEFNPIKSKLLHRLKNQQKQQDKNNTRLQQLFSEIPVDIPYQRQQELQEQQQITSGRLRGNRFRYTSSPSRSSSAAEHPNGAVTRVFKINSRSSRSLMGNGAKGRKANANGPSSNYHCPIPTATPSPSSSSSSSSSSSFFSSSSSSSSSYKAKSQSPHRLSTIINKSVISGTQQEHAAIEPRDNQENKATIDQLLVSEGRSARAQRPTLLRMPPLYKPETLLLLPHAKPTTTCMAQVNSHSQQPPRPSSLALQGSHVFTGSKSIPTLQVSYTSRTPSLSTIPSTSCSSSSFLSTNTFRVPHVQHVTQSATLNVILQATQLDNVLDFGSTSPFTKSKGKDKGKGKDKDKSKGRNKDSKKTTSIQKTVAESGIGILNQLKNLNIWKRVKSLGKDEKSKKKKNQATIHPTRSNAEMPTTHAEKYPESTSNQADQNDELHDSEEEQEEEREEEGQEEEEEEDYDYDEDDYEDDYYFLPDNHFSPDNHYFPDNHFSSDNHFVTNSMYNVPTPSYLEEQDYREQLMHQSFSATKSIERMTMQQSIQFLLNLSNVSAKSHRFYWTPPDCDLNMDGIDLNNSHSLDSHLRNGDDGGGGSSGGSSGGSGSDSGSGVWADINEVQLITAAARNAVQARRRSSLAATRIEILEKSNVVEKTESEQRDSGYSSSSSSSSLSSSSGLPTALALTTASNDFKDDTMAATTTTTGTGSTEVKMTFDILSYAKAYNASSDQQVTATMASTFNISREEEEEEDFTDYIELESEESTTSSSPTTRSLSLPTLRSSLYSTTSEPHMIPPISPISQHNTTLASGPISKSSNNNDNANMFVTCDRCLHKISVEGAMPGNVEDPEEMDSETTTSYQKRLQNWCSRVK
ncbi:hypothetical protein BGX27_000238, partial [Mortierella sp. AM989]